MVIRRVVLHTDRKSASFCERAATRVSWDHHANRAHVGTHTRTTPLLTVTLTILGPQSPVLGTNYLKSEWFVPKTGLRFWKGWSADTKMLSPPNQAATTTNIATYTDRWCYYCCNRHFWRSYFWPIKPQTSLKGQMTPSLNPYSAAVPFEEQTTDILSS